MDLTVVIPTYNEADNIEAMASALLNLGIAGLNILFVDDESPDGTGRIADDLAAQYPGLVNVLHREGNRGLGRAYVDGFRWAILGNGQMYWPGFFLSVGLACLLLIVGFAFFRRMERVFVDVI